jgi:hypothetical protein
VSEAEKDPHRAKGQLFDLFWLRSIEQKELGYPFPFTARNIDECALSIDLA